ncbi:MAG TPA: discoidin domain-containing protein, partial [Actinophytocola sp.]|nr:discoidin domain-containing protein [Actinophytocola sp.]
MERKQPRWRLLTGLLVATVLTVGLLPGSAVAARGAPAPDSAADRAADRVADRAAPNVVLDTTLSASSALPGYPVGNAGDGDQGTYWESTNNAFPQWIQADLGATATVDRVVLQLPAHWEARTQTLTVQGSTTGTSFATLAASRGHAFEPGAGNTVSIPFTATTARYVRVTVTANTGWPAAQVAEFEVHGPDSGDGQAPSAPADLTYTQPASGQIRLAWRASTDDVGVTGYAIYRNNALVATVSGTTLTYTDAPPASATVEYFVRARDAAGNESPDSNRVTRAGQGPAGENLAAGKPIEASSTVHSFVAANANDGNVGSYWESAAGYPSTLTVKLGANADITSVVVKLNPDPIWGPRTQNFEVLGRDQGASAFTSLLGRADHAFDPSTNQNSVTLPVNGRAADVRLRFHGNTGAPGGQVAEFQVIGTPAPNPDLTVTSTEWTPESPTETSELTLSATVRNAGSAPAGETVVNFALDGSVVGDARVAPLAAGASATVSVDAGTRAEGSYTVSSTVDPSDTVVEQDDGNNTHTAPDELVVEQAPGPDLRVLDVTPNPSNPAVGSRVTFTVAVQNRGTSTAGASVTRVSVGGTTLDTDTPAVAAGATATV